MVAIVNSGKSIRKSFFYNDNKLESGAADLLMAENFPMELERMTQQQRLNILLKTASKRPINRPCLHISLNFAPGEKLSNELMKQIATDYMQAIGLGDQPYLMYRHYDSAHPHLHLVTHRINADGDLVDTYMIGRRKSNPARIELEKKYGLVPAKDHEAGLYNLSPVDLSKVIYSKTQTRKAIDDRINYVLKNYKFTSLSALNAVLKGYNISADRGTKDSRIYKKNGLVYHLIGPGDTRIGKLIRASLLNTEATLKHLSKHFRNKNEFTTEQLSRIKNAIDLALKKVPPPTLEEFSALQLKQNIRVVLLKNKAQQIYGISYVDHKTKCALNGSDLGPNYSAKAIQQRCQPSITPSPISSLALESELPPPSQKAGNVDLGTQNTIPTSFEEPSSTGHFSTDGDEKGFFEILLAPEDIYEPLPFQLRRRKKKKKK